MFGSKKSKYTVVASVMAATIVTGTVTSFALNKGEKASLRQMLPRTANLDASSSRYSRPETIKKVDNKLNLEGYKKIMEDSKLEIWHREKNASIRILDKSSGYIWGGLPSDKPEDMNTTWSGIGNSLAAIDYFDNKGLERRMSIADKTVSRKYTISGNVLRYSVTYNDFGISFDFEVELKDGKLSLRMVDDSIKEEKNFSLGAVYFVPFLGSTRADETDGYMFVPDGPGALIRFNKPSQYLINFDKRVYGKDYGIDKLFEINDLKSSRPNDFAIEEPTVAMPIFGVVHGVKQNAIFALIDKGEEYASIMATPSGMVTNYNWITSKFIYRQKYLQPTSRSGAGVQVVQEKRNHFDASITYSFLSGEDADYVGMAKTYRDQLIAEGTLAGKEKVTDKIPLQLDIIGSEIEKGFLFNSVLKVTPIDKIKEIVSELSGEGINNLTMVLQGWQKGGLNGSRPSNFSFESKLGGKDAIIDLSKYAASKGSTLYYYENPVTANKNQIDLREEGGNSLSQALIKIERDNDALWFKDTYYIEPGLATEYISKKADQYKSNGMKAMALDQFGSKLYAENQQDHVTTRIEAREKIEKAAEKASSTLENVALYSPNEYLWKYTDDAFNLPMVNSQYLFETDTVPFLQIVLKGSIDCYAPYSNMSFYSRMDALKLVEFGVYPAFLLTDMSNSELKDTPVSELYSTRYEDWRNNIVAIYQYVNSALSKVEGKMIVDRNVIGQGVVKVDYEDGTSIIVNYTGNDFKFEQVLIPAQDYMVIEGE